MIYHVDLAWPSSDLSPNSRLHWAERSKAVKAARAGAHKAAWAAGIRKMDVEAVRVSTTFFPPGNYHYDDDNLQARCKALFDGIADALGVDDRIFRHSPVERGEVVKKGLVQIKIEVI